MTSGYGALSTLPHHGVREIWPLTRRIPSLSALHDRYRRVEGEMNQNPKSTKRTSVAAVDIPVRGANNNSKELRVSPHPESFKWRLTGRLYRIDTIQYNTT